MSAEIECTPVDPEVPRRHVSAEHLGEGQHEPAHAGVDVAVGADARRQLGDRRDRVDHTLRVLGCRPDDEHRLVVDGIGHRVDVGGVVVAYRHLDDRHVEHVRRLVERGVGRLGHHDRAVSVMPRSARPRSRAASTAHWIDSVPPLVRKPAAVSGPCSSDAVQATASDWMRLSDGNALVFSAFSCRYIVAARSRPRGPTDRRRRPSRTSGRPASGRRAPASRRDRR
jgi:hypothetical protein